MKDQDLRVIKTKRNLHQTLLLLLQKKPLAMVTVTELCKESNITRRTFYLHYESVAKLFEERIEQLLQDLERSFMQTAKYRREIKIGSLEPHMIRIFQHVYDNQELYKIIFSSESNYAYYEVFFDQMKKLVKASVDGIGTFHDISDFELSYHANATLGLIIEWCRHDFAESVEYMNQMLIQILKT